MLPSVRPPLWRGRYDGVDLTNAAFVVVTGVRIGAHMDITPDSDAAVVSPQAEIASSAAGGQPADPASRTHVTRSHWEGHAPVVRTDERVRSQIMHPRESKAHGPHESPNASRAPARSISQRSRTGALRCSFAVSRIRAEIPSGLTSVGPRRITRVSHSHHQLSRPSRTKRL